MRRSPQNLPKVNKRPYRRSSPTWPRMNVIRRRLSNSKLTTTFELLKTTRHYIPLPGFQNAIFTNLLELPELAYYISSFIYLMFCQELIRIIRAYCIQGRRTKKETISLTHTIFDRMSQQSKFDMGSYGIIQKTNNRVHLQTASSSFSSFMTGYCPSRPSGLSFIHSTTDVEKLRTLYLY